MSTGNVGLDALADAIAERVIESLRADREPKYIDAKETARRWRQTLPRMRRPGRGLR